MNTFHSCSHLGVDIKAPNRNKKNGVVLQNCDQCDILGPALRQQVQQRTQPEFEACDTHAQSLDWLFERVEFGSFFF